MKIKRIGNETKQLFETISIGSCFIENDIIYMKTSELVLISKIYNAVCLETGHLFGFSQELYVKPVETELIIKEH